MLLHRNQRFNGIVDRTSVYEIDDALYQQLQSEGLSDSDIFELEYEGKPADKRGIRVVMSIDEVDEINAVFDDEFEESVPGTAEDNGHLDALTLADYLDSAATADIYYEPMPEDGEEAEENILNYQRAMEVAASIIRQNADILNNEVPSNLIEDARKAGLLSDVAEAAELASDPVMGLTKALRDLKADPTKQLYQSEVSQFGEDDARTPFDTVDVVVAAHDDQEAKELAQMYAEANVVVAGNVAFEASFPIAVSKDDFTAKPKKSPII